MAVNDALAIKQANPLSEIIGKNVTLTKNGHEYKGSCPFHKEKTASFTIYRNDMRYKCFGCGAHGSVIDYVMLTRGMNYKEACKVLKEGKNLEDFKFAPLEISRHDIYDDYKVILPVPAHAVLLNDKTDTPSIYRPRKSSFKIYSGKIVNNVCGFKDLDGNLIGYEFRIIIPETKEEKEAREKLGKKQEKTPMPVTWCRRPDGSEGWTLRKFDNPKPLYGQERLKESGQILIVEGAPKVEACKGNIGSLIPIAMMGGAGGYRHAHLELLKGRKIVIWPDKDKRGEEFALNIAATLHDIGVESIKILTPPEDSPESWDAKDAFQPKNGESPWDYQKFLSWAKESAVTYTKPEVIIENVPAEETASKKKKEKKTKEFKPSFEHNNEFKILGYNNGICYYMPRLRPRVIGLTTPQHTKGYLSDICSNKSWWENYYGFEGKIKWDDAGMNLVNASKERGFFMGQHKRRGVGAWIDDGRKIFHMGEHILLDGQKCDIFNFESDFVYEEEDYIKISPEIEKNILPTHEAIKLIKICESLPWENKLSGKLLAGWCVIAPICGMLEWRPNIWITGAPDSGKSFANTFIVRKMMQLFSYSVDGGTTEAAMRRDLQKSAMPVIFDEAEAKGDRATAIMQAILFYMRKSSSGAEIRMVRKDLQVEKFIIRSIFCLSSIDTNIEDEADDTRITQLDLKKPYKVVGEAFAEFNDLRSLAELTFTKEYSAGMFKRAFNNIEILMHNIKIFEAAGTKTFSQVRHARQLAPLLAGAYLCHNLKKIEPIEAEAWIAGNDWQDILSQQSEKDHDRLFGIIMSQSIRISDGNKNIQVTVGEMILSVNKYSDNSSLYDKQLRLLGIIVSNEKDVINIANQSPEIAKILRGSAWKRNWNRTLKRIAGSGVSEFRYWAPGITKGTRGITLPISLIREESTPPVIKNIEELGEEVKFDDS